MKTSPTRNLINFSSCHRRTVAALLALALGCFALSPRTLAVDPARAGGYPNGNTAEGTDAPFGLTAGAENTVMGSDALDSNTTGSESALASWIWRTAGRLNSARFLHTATLLQNGMVLVTGGAPSARSELYDPASGTSTGTGSLNSARYLHTATLLPNGMVLVAGGYDSNFNPSASAELYDQASGTWTVTGSLNTARGSHTATLIENGRVLVAGGTDDYHILRTAELGHGHR